MGSFAEYSVTRDNIQGIAVRGHINVNNWANYNFRSFSGNFFFRVGSY